MLLTLGWGLNWPASKLAMIEMDPLMQRSLTLLIGGPGLLAIARSFGFSLRVPIAEALALIPVSALFVSGYHTAIAYGLPLMPAGRASIIANTVPLWVVLLSIWLLREPPSRPSLFSLALGLAGISLLMSPDLIDLGGALLGSILLIAAAFSSALGSVAMKTFAWTTPVAVLTGWAVLVGGLPIYAIALLSDTGPMLPSSIPGVVALAHTIIVSTILGHWCFFKLVVLYSPSVASIASLTVPVAGVFGSAVILDEPIGVIEVTSLVLVLSGLVCLFCGGEIQIKRRGIATAAAPKRRRCGHILE